MSRVAEGGATPRQAILLVGGRGTRMWPLTAESPKALLPLGGLPFVEYQLRQLAAVGVEEVFLAIGAAEEESWRRYVADSNGDLDLRLAIETSPLDTAGGVRQILDELADRFFVLNGDVVLETDLAAVAAGDRPATIGLVEVEDTSAYGVVVVRDDATVERFVEKPPPEEAPARTVSAGIYVLERKALEGYPMGPLSFERVVFPDLVAAGDLAATVLRGDWIDIGTPSLYLRSHAAVHSGATALHTPPGHVSDGVEMSGTVGGAWSWIGPGAVIGDGAEVSESVVFGGATVESDAVVRGGIVGPGATIGAGSTVELASIIGPRADIGPGCEITAGMRVAPDAVLAAGSVTFRPPS